jgi:two-component system, NtrC family, nitrogen regulation response regulator NtrX
MALDILIVDDEQDIRDLVSGVLDDEGYGTRTAASADEALAALDERLPSLILLDVWLRGSSMDGIELLRAIKLRDPQIPVIVFSGHGNIDTAVAAIGHGAADFIEKPFEASKLLHLVSKATETERLRAEKRGAKGAGRAFGRAYRIIRRDQRGARHAQESRGHRQPDADHWPRWRW